MTNIILSNNEKKLDINDSPYQIVKIKIDNENAHKPSGRLKDTKYSIGFLI